MPGSIPGTSTPSPMLLQGCEVALLQAALSPHSSQAQFWSGGQSRGLFPAGGLNKAETVSGDTSCSEPAGLSTQLPCPSCRRIVQIHSEHGIQLPVWLPGVLFLILVILQFHYIL